MRRGPGPGRSGAPARRDGVGDRWGPSSPRRATDVPQPENFDREEQQDRREHEDDDHDEHLLPDVQQGTGQPSERSALGTCVPATRSLAMLCGVGRESFVEKLDERLAGDR